jgi:hypothetical protein
MQGNIGVGYRLFNEVFLGMQLHPRQQFNDQSIICKKVSEFIYMPLVNDVHMLALRKESYHQIIKDKFFKKYEKRWVKRYKKTI